MKAASTSIYDFPTMITGGYVYVDKTEVLYELAKSGADKLCYLSRPRLRSRSAARSATDAYAADGRRVVYVDANCNPPARTFDTVRTEVVSD